MPVTLAEASRGTVPALDARVIDEFRKLSPMLDALPFDPAVNPAGGGATWSYQYRRLVTQRGAAFRQINTEYTPSEVETQIFTSNLAPLGGSFQIDRVLNDVGPAAASELNLQMSQVIKASTAFFSDQVINGDTAVTSYGFDGLSKALAASSTELGTTAVSNWTDLSDTNKQMNVLDQLDDFLQALNGAPTMLIGNKYILSRVRAVARRAGMYVRNPIEGLLNAQGNPIVREQYGEITFVDAGEKAGSSNLVIPNRSATVGGVAQTGLTDLYAVRIGLDGFHGVSFAGRNIVRQFLPDFTTPGAVKTGEVELGPIGVALKATKAAAVLRNIKVV